MSTKKSHCQTNSVKAMKVFMLTKPMYNRISTTNRQTDILIQKGPGNLLFNTAQLLPGITPTYCWPAEKHPPSIMSLFYNNLPYRFAFSALTLLVWHLAGKTWVMRCWCGYLSAARCRLLAYCPADATAILKPHHHLPHLNPDWFYLSSTCLHRLFWKTGR